jgi:hypothetical protein
MSGCRNRQDLTFQYPCSVGSPREAGEPRRGSVPPARRGNLKEGVNCSFFVNAGSAIGIIGLDVGVGGGLPP